MKEISATDAARRFSDVLDAVEHRGQSFVVVRKGRPVARIGPTSEANGRLVKQILRRLRPDTKWAAELKALREGLATQERHWPD